GGGTRGGGGESTGPPRRDPGDEASRGHGRAASAPARLGGRPLRIHTCSVSPSVLAGFPLFQSAITGATGVPGSSRISGRRDTSWLPIAMRETKRRPASAQ